MGGYIVKVKTTSAGSRGHSLCTRAPLAPRPPVCLPRMAIWLRKIPGFPSIALSSNFGCRQRHSRHWCSFIFAGRAGGSLIRPKTQKRHRQFQTSHMHASFPGSFWRWWGREDFWRGAHEKPGITTLNRVNLSAATRWQPRVPAAKEDGGSRVKGKAAQVWRRVSVSTLPRGNEHCRCNWLG